MLHEEGLLLVSKYMEFELVPKLDCVQPPAMKQHILCGFANIVYPHFVYLFLWSRLFILSRKKSFGVSGI